MDSTVLLALKGGITYRAEWGCPLGASRAAEPANVGLMRTGVVQFAAAHGAAASTQNDIALAVSEGLTNCVVHAFVAQHMGTMGLIAVARSGVFHVRIIDDGRGMRPRGDSPGLRGRAPVRIPGASRVRRISVPRPPGPSLQLNLVDPQRRPCDAVQMSSSVGRRGFFGLVVTGVAGAVVGVPLSGCGASSSGDAGPHADR